MRRADRLFTIVQLLRGGRNVTARMLADRLEVSERTIYRDVVELTLCGVPITGEPGVGYTLPHSFEIPPLMFERHEIDALVIGARMVDSWCGPGLAASARSALAKIRGAVPAALVADIDGARVYSPPSRGRRAPKRFDLIHEAIGAGLTLAITYADEEQQSSERTVRPLGLFFWGNKWTLVAWCELRNGFRSFRIDRIRQIDSGAAFTEDPAKNLEAFFLTLPGRPRNRGALD